MYQAGFRLDYVKQIEEAVDIFSYLDHQLFQLYIRREENPTRFRRAFWSLNTYGQQLAQILFKNFEKQNRKTTLSLSSTSRDKQQIAFVFKGPYQLAHSEFLHNFLKGCKVFSDVISITLILLDSPLTEKIKIELTHINCISLSEYPTTFSKLKHYYSICHHKFDHISWVAAVQNLTLYMGMQLAPKQSYWSMKYHSIIMPTIQKYAGLGYGGNSFDFDDIKWFRGRAFPDLGMQNTTIPRSHLHSLLKIPDGSLLVGCFVRSEKLYDLNFWDSIVSLLNQRHDLFFAVASQSLPKAMDSYLRKKLKKTYNRVKYLGWVNTKKIVYALDVYFDSTPRGSCNTIFEAIEANVPVLMADTPFNRESSALPYLVQTINSKSNRLENYGIFYDEQENQGV